jgi:hypothetical protein
MLGIAPLLEKVERTGVVLLRNEIDRTIDT